MTRKTNFFGLIAFRLIVYLATNINAEIQIDKEARELERGSENIIVDIIDGLGKGWYIIVIEIKHVTNKHIVDTPQIIRGNRGSKSVVKSGTVIISMMK